MKRPYKLVWTDSCRHTQSFASHEAAYRAAVKATPCRGLPCKWAIVRDGEVLRAGAI